MRITSTTRGIIPSHIEAFHQCSGINHIFEWQCLPSERCRWSHVLSQSLRPRTYNDMPHPIFLWHALLRRHACSWRPIGSQLKKAVLELLRSTQRCLHHPIISQPLIDICRLEHRCVSQELTQGKYVIVRINDRGPFVKGRIIDVSRQAAELLGMIDAGVTRVKLEIVEEEIVAITLRGGA